MPPNSPGFTNSNNYVLVDNYGSSQVAAYLTRREWRPHFGTQKTSISGFLGVPHETLQELLYSNRGAESACRKLVDLANQDGGKDNTTAIVSYFLEPKADESRAFVEAEVPSEDLTAASSDTSKTVVFFDPIDAVKSATS